MSNTVITRRISALNKKLERFTNCPLPVGSRKHKEYVKVRTEYENLIVKAVNARARREGNETRAALAQLEKTHPGLIQAVGFVDSPASRAAVIASMSVIAAELKQRNHDDASGEGGERNTPTDAQIRVILKKLNVKDDATQPYDWPEFVKRGINRGSLTQAKSARDVRAIKSAGGRKNLYYVWDVVKCPAWFTKFSA